MRTRVATWLAAGIAFPVRRSDGSPAAGERLRIAARDVDGAAVAERAARRLG